MNSAYNASNNIPPFLPTRFENFDIKNRAKPKTIMTTPLTIVVEVGMVKAPAIIAKPRTKRLLKMVLPTILLTAISESPFRTPMTETASSGSEVPTATMVTPIMNSLMPN